MLIWFLQNNKGVIFRSLEKVLNLHAELQDLCKTCTLKMYATCDRHNSALYWNCLNDVQNIIAQIKKSCILHCAAFFFFFPVSPSSSILGTASAGSSAQAAPSFPRLLRPMGAGGAFCSSACLGSSLLAHMAATRSDEMGGFISMKSNFP